MAKPGTVEKLPTAPKWDDDTLRSITDFNAAVALVEQEFGGIAVASEEMGDGFTLLLTEDKIRLVGVPLMFLRWDFHLGETTGEFVSAHVVTKDGGRYIINDGSTGIHAQLWAYTEKHQRQGGLFVEKGLRKSDYMVEIPDPKTGEMKEQPATTYYIDTATKN
jgi:hypothetical protein